MSQLANTKRFSLKDVAESWGEDCYLTYRPASVMDLIAMREQDIDKSDEVKGLQMMIEFARSHVVGGAVRVLDDAGQEIIGTFEPDHVNQLDAETIGRIFQAMTASKVVDPKVLNRAARRAKKPSGAGRSTDS